MILLDTDILTLLVLGHEQVRNHVNRAEDTVVISIISRIEVLQGRFDGVLKAADGAQLLQAMLRLQQSEQALRPFLVIPINDAAPVEFDKLRQNRKLKKIGRADLLIAAIALANTAKLITRNLRHFQQLPGLQVANWAD